MLSRELPIALSFPAAIRSGRFVPVKGCQSSANSGVHGSAWAVWPGWARPIAYMPGRQGKQQQGSQDESRGQPVRRSLSRQTLFFEGFPPILRSIFL